MSWDRTARRLAPPSPLSLLLVLVLLSRAGALHPEELFPYGESWGDRLLREGDVESSAAVKLAGVEQLTSMFNCHRRWGPDLAAVLQLLDPYCGGIRIISRESWNRPPLLRLPRQEDEIEASSAVCL
ncbi:rCG38188 [Rattus norvegicus]|uniref:RCG38188 n=1 Tax=Rattus norvegicus TaxID=10116 RepID=A6KUP6_RAT|nr:rCG38188 [Rattus norvegicus]